MYFTRDEEYPWAVVRGKLKKGITVLDAGCGNAPFSFYLAELGCNVFAVDTQDYSEFFRSSGVKFRQNCLSKLPFADGTFDRVFCISVFEHLEDSTLELILAEFSRVLKKDGLLILTVDKENSCRPHDFFKNYSAAIKGKFSVLEEKDLYEGKIKGFVCSWKQVTSSL